MLDHAMELIEKESSQLEGILPKDYHAFNNDSLLHELLRLFNNDVLDDVGGDIIGRIYEYFLNKFAKNVAQDDGVFFTPKSLVKMIVYVLEPKKGILLDPACGSGGMLIEAVHHMHYSELCCGSIFGQEKNVTNAAIAKMNLYLHGAIDFNIMQGDTLREPKILQGGQLARFDCVIANPPFALKDWGAKEWNSDKYGRNLWGNPGDGCGDYAWIEHMVMSMARGTGRLAVVMPQGVLFRNQGKEKDIRRQMVESGLIEAVFPLGEKLFYGTGLSPCFLIMRRTMPANHSGRILMVDGSSILTPKRAQNVLEQKDIDKLYQLYVDYRDEEDYSRVVTLDDVRAKDYILSPSSYVQYHEEEVEPYESVRQRFMDAYEEMKRCEREFREAISDAGK
ncbi:MAG TPA: DNA methylase [Dialister sp.]|nr:DNA methylase [Dialister sp.]